VSANRRTTFVLLFLAVSALSGCFGSDDKKGGARQAHVRQQEQKCFKDSGCNLACGSEGHFHQINSKIKHYLNTARPAGGKPQLGDAIALLPADDSKCYTCAAPCMQTATPIGAASASPDACTPGDGSIVIALGADATGPATSFCRASYNASLNPASLAPDAAAPAASPQPQATTTYKFDCICP
jgi:hypothetical protein